VAVWAFHGENDQAVPVNRATAMVQSIEQAGGSVKLTVLPGEGHSICNRVYQQTEVLDWLLQQSRQTGMSAPRRGATATNVTRDIEK
jgi:dipeptidyl aminopeptidase/acylaminoacyl peptidase